MAAMPRPVRRRLPDERQSITHKFDIAGHEGYITVGLFEDGQPGEIFLVMAKEGSTISGFADAFAQAISYALQYGVPLQVLVDKFSHARFEPSGMTRNPEVRFAKSIVDYIFRWMSTKFMSKEAQFNAGVNMAEPAQLEINVAEPDRGEGRRQSRGAEGRIRRCGDPEPGRRAAMLDLRLDHDSERQLLQVRQLRHDERLRVTEEIEKVASCLNATVPFVPFTFAVASSKTRRRSRRRSRPPARCRSAPRPASAGHHDERARERRRAAPRPTRAAP